MQRTRELAALDMPYIPPLPSLVPSSYGDTPKYAWTTPWRRIHATCRRMSALFVSGAGFKQNNPTTRLLQAFWERLNKTNYHVWD